MTGTIKRLTDKGFGFITGEGLTKDLFFHSNSLVGVTFDELKEGDSIIPVTLDEPLLEEFKEGILQPCSATATAQLPDRSKYIFVARLDIKGGAIDIENGVRIDLVKYTKEIGTKIYQFEDRLEGKAYPVYLITPLEVNVEDKKHTQVGEVYAESVPMEGIKYVYKVTVNEDGRFDLEQDQEIPVAEEKPAEPAVAMAAQAPAAEEAAAPAKPRRGISPLICLALRWIRSMPGVTKRKATAPSIT